MANITPIIYVPQLEHLGVQWHSAEQIADPNGLTITTVLHGKADRQALFNNESIKNLQDQRIGNYGFFAGHNIKYGYGKYDEIDMTCIDLVLPFGNGSYYSRFEAQGRTISRPLEEKREKIGANDETYKTWWNYKVVSTDSSESITESEWKAIDDNSIPSGYSAGTARWIKSNQAIASGEYIIMDARFPGVQGFGVAELQVKEIVYTYNESIAQQVCLFPGYKREPTDSFGTKYYGGIGDASNWLITSASYKKRLGWYEAERTYAYAKGGWLDNQSVDPATGVYPEL